MNNIEQAMQVLKDAGYYVDSLWHINDVKNDFKVSDEEAYEILNEALTHEYIIQETWRVINDIKTEQ